MFETSLRLRIRYRRSSLLLRILVIAIAGGGLACSPIQSPQTSEAAEGEENKDVVRWLQRKDLEAITEIERQSFSEPSSEDELLRELSKDRTGGIVFERNGKVIGFLIYSAYYRSFHIENIAVHPGARRQGIARKMFEKLEYDLHHENSERHYVTAIVRESNSGARAFLKELRWQEPLPLKNYFPGSQEAAYALVKTRYRRDIPAENMRNILISTGYLLESAIESNPDEKVEEQRKQAPSELSKKSRGPVTNPALKKLAERYTNLTAKVTQDAPPFEITDQLAANSIRMALQRREVGSVVILAEAGSGKTELVKSFVWELAQGRYPELAKDTPIFQVDAGSLSAGTKFSGEFEERVKEITDAAAKMPIVLFIDEVHSLSGQGTHSQNSNDFWEHLKPSLADGRIRVIGTSTEQEFNAAYAGRTAVYARFEQHKKQPLTRAEVVGAINLWNQRFGIPALPQPLCERLYDLSEQFDAFGAQPRKVAKLVDYLHAKRSIEGRSEQPVSIEEIHAAAQAKYQVDPVQFDPQKMREKIERLRETLNSRFVGRADATEALYQGTKQSFVRMPGDQKADMIMMLMGPRGTGKTEFAKAYAEHMGFRSRLIEMNAYSRSGGKLGEQLMQEIAEAVRFNSQAVIILDEIEKADRSIQDRLLAAFQDGSFYVTEKTSSGDLKGTSIRVSLRNVKILLTTNAGQDYIAQGGTDPYDMREAGIREGLSEFLVDRVQGVLPFAPAMDRDAFARIVTEHLQRQINAYESVPGNPPLAVEARDRLIAEIVQKHWRGARTSPRAALSEVDARLKSAITDALYDRAGTGVGPCDLLYVKFGGG